MTVIILFFVLACLLHDAPVSRADPTATHLRENLIAQQQPIAVPLATCFTYCGSGAPPWPSVAWGDYDRDGDLDFALFGQGSIPSGRVYINIGANYLDSGQQLESANQGSVAWGDYDNDGDLDLLTTGFDHASVPRTTVYRQTLGVFADVGAGLEGVYLGGAVWGDYDNDGDLDILVTGVTGASRLTRIYRNDQGTSFTDISADLPGLFRGSAAWGDYDNDAHLDILLTGNTNTAASPAPIAEVYRNDGGGAFVATGAGLSGIWKSSGVWVDYDNDGDLDIGTIGATGTDEVLGAAPISRVYRNDGGGAFADAGVVLVGVYEGAMAWGDYDGDGDADFTLMGGTGAYAGAAVCRQYRNNITAFSNVGTLLGFEDGLDDNPTGAYDGSAEWGVANATLLTNRLIVAGLCTNPPFAGNILREYRTTCGDAFTRPTAPTGLTAQLVGDQLTLGWNAASDFQTSSSGLSYNLRVGTTSGGGEVISAMSDASGFRSVPRLGNAQKRTSWTVRVPIAGRYYWSVQAIDAGNLGGPFASEQQVAGLLGVDDGVVHGEALDLRFVSPVGAMVEFQLRLPTSSHVRFSIVDIGGREIAILANHELQAGAHEITWASEGLRAGVYFAALRAGRQTLVRRVVVLR